MKPKDSAEKVTALLSADRPVLAELREIFPEAWTVVHEELLRLAEAPDPGRLAEVLTQAYREWQAMKPQCQALRQNFDQRNAGQCGLLLIRKIAIEQYCRALQHETLNIGGQGGLRDRLLTRLLILPMALSRRALPYRLHRLAWRLLHNPAAATAMLMQAGCYVITPQELIASLAERIGSRPTLEIGAGRGVLAACLRRCSTAITAVDDYSWADTLPMGSEVLHLEGREALSRYRPRVVVCCWPPPGNDFEQAIFATPEVEEYIVITSRHRHASGDHQAYAGAAGFRCLQATGLLAEMLLPPEAGSVLYIFSRIMPSGESHQSR